MSGHYEEVGRRIGEMVDGKQVLYGDSFTAAPQMLRLLYPDGVRPEQYDDLLSIVRCLDKFKRIATANDADGENPWVDVAGYAILEEGRGEMRAASEPEPWRWVGDVPKSPGELVVLEEGESDRLNSLVRQGVDYDAALRSVLRDRSVQANEPSMPATGGSS